MKQDDPFEIYTNTSASGQAPKSLEWEEAANDSLSPVEGFVAAAEADETTPKRKIWPLHLAVVILCLILTGKLASLQLIQGAHFREVAEGNRLRNRTILAPRGQIVDRTGAPLATNTASFSLVAVPADLPKEGWQTEVDRLNELIPFDKNEVMDKLSKADPHSLQPIPLKQGITSDESILFATRANEFYGFSVDSIPIREYPESQMFSHMLGYTGLISAPELANRQAEKYDLNDFIGKSGIESFYEKYIRGINGVVQTEVDATGRPVKVLGTSTPIAGNQITLNINKGLQEELYKAFEKIGSKTKGAAVAMNPKTGEVLALVSVPGFDNNLFAPGVSTVQYDSWLHDPALPLFNRFLAGTYPPGSTVKPMVAAAALQEKIVTENTVIQDKGVLVIPNQFNPGINYNFYGWKRSGLGPMTARSAIAESSDIYFYTVAGGYFGSTIDGLGVEKLAQYYRRFHLGQPTGLDLSGEKAGLVADPEWKARYFKDDAVLSKWYLGDTYHIGIGQGDMLVTPLQVALWTATIANNGTGMKPILLKKVTDPATGKIIFETKPEAIVSPGIDPAHMKVVQEGMRETVLYGSGVSLNTLSIPIAGKTGTSQFDGSDLSRTHAWFTSYAPFDDPQIVITILVEAGGEGHEAAVPIAKAAYTWCTQNNCLQK